MNSVVTPAPGSGSIPIHVPPQFGAKILTFGATGAGKTHALRTLRTAGIKLFVLFSENGMTSLQDTDPEWVDWHYVPPAPSDLTSMINMARQINTLDRKQLANYQDPYRAKHNQMVEVLQCMANLKGDRTGKTYGPVDQLGQDWCFALDSISGVSIMSMELVGGDKPMFDQGEWGIAMGRIEKMIHHLCFNIPCHVIVNGHEERETDEIAGGTKIMVSVPGKKLAPKVPRFFDDVFYAFRKDKQYNWSTNYPQVADLKSRHLGIFESLPQDYNAVITARNKQIAAATK